MEVAICEEIAAFSQNTLTKVMLNFEESLLRLIHKEKHNLSDAIKKVIFIYEIG